jgi:hypothetical protein
MDIKSKLVKQKIFESWSPKIKKHLERKGIKNISESRLRSLCESAQVRKLYENATTQNTGGRGAFSLGNNTANASDTTRGSEGAFDSLFGVFIDTYAGCVGLDLVPNLQMTKSNLVVNIIEPVYAGGIIGSGTDRPEMFQVKIETTGTPNDLVVGTAYLVKSAFADADGDAVCTLVYVGKDRGKGHAIFRLTGTNASQDGESIATILDGNSIFSSGVNYIGFDATTVHYVNAYTNFVQGFAGSGLEDNVAWRSGMSDNVHSPMNRQTGETQRFRSMGLNKWSENFSAETSQVKIGYTTEMLQDLAMEEGMDAVQLAFDAISNELDQSMNAEITTTIAGTGWGHHHLLSTTLGINLNLHLSTATGNAQTYRDETNVSRTIAGATGALISGSNGDNLPSMQRRIVSRMAYASSIVGQRSRRGKANGVVTNATISPAVCDVRGFQPAPFENDLVDNENLYILGSLNKMTLYENPLQEINDNRISVLAKGSEKDAGLKMLNYILAEKLDAVAEGTMQTVTVLKSRYKLASVGVNPSFNYLTFTVTSSSAQGII